MRFLALGHVTEIPATYQMYFIWWWDFLFKDRWKFPLNLLVQERAKCTIAFTSTTVHKTGSVSGSFQ